MKGDTLQLISANAWHSQIGHLASLRQHVGGNMPRNLRLCNSCMCQSAAFALHNLLCEEAKRMDRHRHRHRYKGIRRALGHLFTLWCIAIARLQPVVAWRPAICRLHACERFEINELHASNVPGLSHAMTGCPGFICADQPRQRLYSTTQA